MPKPIPWSYSGIVCSCGSTASSQISKLFGEAYPRLYIKCDDKLCGKRSVLQQKTMQSEIDQELYGSKLELKVLQKSKLELKIL